MKADNEPLALRPREAAKALGVSERTLWGWTHDGTIPHLRVGRAILYPTDALREWLRARSEGGNATAEAHGRHGRSWRRLSRRLEQPPPSRSPSWPRRKQGA